jgi:hypothetical protein
MEDINEVVDWAVKDWFETYARYRYEVWKAVPELSLDQKIKLMEEVVKWLTYGEYICVRINLEAVALGYISQANKIDIGTILALRLLPELYLFKPDGASLGGPWFGILTTAANTSRRTVVEDLLELLKKQQNLE